jgi:hypothetical protein
MLTHVESALQARAWVQQLCSVQVSHAVSVGEEGHEPPPPLLLPLLLPLPPLHCDAQSLAAHALRLVKAAFAGVQVQLLSVHASSHATQAWSLLHAVAWVQHWAARHWAHVEVPVMAGQEPPPEELLPELEQLPDVDPPPMPPPIPPPPLDELQLLLLPLEDEQPMIPTAATTAQVLTKRMTGFIGELSCWRCSANLGARITRRRAPQWRCRDFDCGPRGVV